MRMRDVANGLCLIVLLVAGAVATAASEDSPAAKRLRDLVKVINSADGAAAEKFVRETYAPEFLKMPMEAHLGFIGQVYGRTRGLELKDVENVSATEVTATVQSKLTGELHALVVRVEPEAPHRITAIGRKPAKAPARGQSARQLTEGQAVAELEAYVQKLAAADAFSGVVLLAKDGKPLLLKAWGDANKDFAAPNKADTKFNLGSMNKMFTAVATLQLVERGKLSLEDPLSRFLPEFPTKEAADKIRVKHLLTHTSGLGSYFNDAFRDSSRARWRTVDQMMELAKDEKPQFEPGEKWGYSNTGFLVLGKVIEKVTGQDYYDYVRENVYRPAGMANTDCYELDRVNPNLAVGYEGDFGKNGTTWKNNVFEHVIRGGPAGGGYSTAEDLLRFDRALRGGKLLSPPYVNMLLSAKPELKSPDYGFGFQVSAGEGGSRVAGHGGGFPGISSNLDMFLNAEGDKGPQWTTVILSNYGGAAPPVMEKARELLAAVRRTNGEAQTAGASDKRADADDTFKAQAALQGTWRVVTELVGGNATGEDITGHRLVIDGPRYAIRNGEREIMSGTFKLDPAQTPRAIDLECDRGNAAGHTTLAIYEVGGDKLKMCIADGPDATERPRLFDSAGTQNMSVELEREKQ